MFKFDHFVINVDKSYQMDKDTIEKITKAGFLYEPTWGKGTKGFKASNIWIGDEYFEMINILKPHGGGWKEDWVEYYNNGHRGLICIMLDVENIEELYKILTEKNINITNPEHLKFKWFFNILTRTMPWKNSYVNFFEGVPLQIGFQQMDDEKARDFMTQYMVPNSRDNNILGINKVTIKGALSDNDKNTISTIFDSYIINSNPLTIKLNEEQVIVFEESERYEVDIFTKCNNKEFNSKCVNIENICVRNAQL